MNAIEISQDDPRRGDITDLLAQHLRHANLLSPPEHVHALDIEGLCVPEVQFYSARTAEELLGIGALRMLDDEHFEIKSMHTAEAARGQGVGQAMVKHLLQVASNCGGRRVSLETGTMPGMAPARRLYERLGFAECAPFGDYRTSDFSVCMATYLEPPG